MPLTNTWHSQSVNTGINDATQTHQREDEAATVAKQQLNHSATKLLQ